MISDASVRCQDGWECTDPFLELHAVKLKKEHFKLTNTTLHSSQITTPRAFLVLLGTLNSFASNFSKAYV